jgi:hypothetical protein
MSIHTTTIIKKVMEASDTAKSCRLKGAEMRINIAASESAHAIAMAGLRAELADADEATHQSEMALKVAAEYLCENLVTKSNSVFNLKMLIITRTKEYRPMLLKLPLVRS